MITYYPEFVDSDTLAKMRKYIMDQACGLQVKLPIGDCYVSVWSHGRRKYIVDGSWEEVDTKIYVGNAAGIPTPEWAVSVLIALVDCYGLRGDQELIDQISRFRDNILAQKIEAAPRGVAESYNGQIVYQFAVNLAKNLVAGRYEEGGPYRMFSGEPVDLNEPGWVELQQ